MSQLSPRLREIVDALPLHPGLRVIEVGCGTGGAAFEIARRVGPHGHVLAIDRSAAATARTEGAGAELIAAGALSVRRQAVEALRLEPGEAPYDLAVAVRVGALDGRHRALEAAAHAALRAALVPGGRIYLDGGDPLRMIDLGGPDEAQAPT